MVAALEDETTVSAFLSTFNLTVSGLEKGARRGNILLEYSSTNS
jgi:hypothetical protein